MSNVATEFTAAIPTVVPNLPLGESRREGKIPRHSGGGSILLAKALHKNYRKGPVEVPVLRGVSLAVRQGEFLAIVGQSGCGKTTLLHLLGTLDLPDRGEIHFEGERIDGLPSHRRDWLRNRRFGMIFQFYHLLPEMTTLENVLAPLMITHGVFSYWRQRRQFKEQAAELLDDGGLGPSPQAPPPRAFRRGDAARSHRPVTRLAAQPFIGR